MDGYNLSLAYRKMSCIPVSFITANDDGATARQTLWLDLTECSLRYVRTHARTCSCTHIHTYVRIYVHPKNDLFLFCHLCFLSIYFFMFVSLFLFVFFFFTSFINFFVLYYFTFLCTIILPLPIISNNVSLFKQIVC